MRPIPATRRDPDPRLDPRALARSLAAFRTPGIARSLWELAATLIPFLALLGITLAAVQAGYYLALALIPLAGLLLLRLFIIQHDCGHGSFFRSQTANDWLGRAIAVFTFTPYDCWRRSHALHHSSTGNLDARGYGDVDTLTVREYTQLGQMQRALYRFYRHPAVLLTLGPVYLFLLRHRLPIGLMKEGSIYWVSAMATNAVTGLLLVALALTFGALVTLAVFLPILLIAASTGVWLFYVQHQFEHAHWDYKSGWAFHEAALRGSSYLDLPAPLRWFTGNIGIHHVHHLVSRIPFYRLPGALHAHPQLHDFNRITMRQTLRPLNLALWDEDTRRLVTFAEASRISAKPA